MFEINLSFENTELWEESLDKVEGDGKLKFPVTFHDQIPPIEEIPDQLTLLPPKKQEKSVRVIQLGKNKKDKKGLF
jgi:hypothetical protein